MTPCCGNTILRSSSQKLLLSPSQTPEWLFELTRCPGGTLDLPCALLPERQSYKNTARCAALSAKVPGESKNSLHNLFGWVENALFTLILDGQQDDYTVPIGYKNLG